MHPCPPPQLSSFLYLLSLFLSRSSFSAVDHFLFQFLALLYSIQVLSSTCSRRWKQEEHGENNRTAFMLVVSAPCQWSLWSEIRVTSVQLDIMDTPDLIHILHAHSYDKNSTCKIFQMCRTDWTRLYHVQNTHRCWYKTLPNNTSNTL